MSPESGANLNPELGWVQPDPLPTSRLHPQGWHDIKVQLKGALEGLACGPGSEPLIRQWRLSHTAFNVVRWYFSGFFSEGKS